MTTDTAVLERALIVMAVCMAIQTLLFVGAARRRVHRVAPDDGGAR